MFCRGCNQELLAEAFSPDSHSATGYQSRCRSCRSVKHHRDADTQGEVFRTKLALQAAAMAPKIAWNETLILAEVAPQLAIAAAEKTLAEIPRRSYWERLDRQILVDRARYFGHHQCLCEIYNADTFEDDLNLGGHRYDHSYTWHLPAAGCPVHKVVIEGEFWLAPAWEKQPPFWRPIGFVNLARRQRDMYLRRRNVIPDLLVARQAPTAAFLMGWYT